MRRKIAAPRKPPQHEFRAVWLPPPAKVGVYALLRTSGWRPGPPPTRPYETPAEINGIGACPAVPGSAEKTAGQAPIPLNEPQHEFRAVFLAPSPLVGEGWGGGASHRHSLRTSGWRHRTTPHPNPPPQGGRGPNTRSRHRLRLIQRYWGKPYPTGGVPEPKPKLHRPLVVAFEAGSARQPRRPCRFR